MTVNSLTAVAEFVGRTADGAGLGQKDAYRLRLAIDELVTNIITHGYPHGPTGEIELCSSTSNGRALLLIVDSAMEFDPTRHRYPVRSADPGGSQIGGLGLVLTQMSADRLIYERTGDLNRTIIVVRRTGRDLTDHEDH